MKHYKAGRFHYVEGRGQIIVMPWPKAEKYPELGDIVEVYGVEYLIKGIESSDSDINLGLLVTKIEKEKKND